MCTSCSHDSKRIWTGLWPGSGIPLDFMVDFMVIPWSTFRLVYCIVTSSEDSLLTALQDRGRMDSGDPHHSNLTQDNLPGSQVNEPWPLLNRPDLLLKVLPESPKKGHAASSFTIARWWLRQFIYRAYSLTEWCPLSQFYRICQYFLGLSASSIPFADFLGHHLIFCPYFLKVLLGGHSGIY